jgi:hypothetical protein
MSEEVKAELQRFDLFFDEMIESNTTVSRFDVSRGLFDILYKRLWDLRVINIDCPKIDFVESADEGYMDIIINKNIYTLDWIRNSVNKNNIYVHIVEQQNDDGVLLPKFKLLNGREAKFLFGTNKPLNLGSNTE